MVNVRIKYFERANDSPRFHLQRLYYAGAFNLFENLCSCDMEAENIAHVSDAQTFVCSDHNHALNSNKQNFTAVGALKCS